MKSNWKTKFYRIWIGQFFSIITSAILQMALIWYITFQTKSVLVLSIASIAAFLPTAILGSFVGVLVDRWNRKFVMICADLYIAGISLLIVIVGLFHTIPAWFIIIILCLRSIGTAFHTPAISAVTPLLVPEDQLLSCSGYTQSIQTVGYIIGTALAGVLYPICSMEVMVAFDVVGALLASGFVLFVHIPKPSLTHHENPHFINELKEGLQIYRKQKGLYALLWIGAAFMFFYSPINALFPLISIEHFQGTTTSASIAEIAFSVGMLLGGVILGTCCVKFKRSSSMIFSLALMGISILVSGILPSTMFPCFVFLCIGMGISVPFYTGPQTALMQERIEPQYLGRAFGVYGSIASLAMPLGLSFSAVFGDSLGVQPWFIICGMGSIALACVSYLIPSIRNIDANH
ncbi:MAG: MFS transporter [Longicatena sp.]